jgi:hypothetical protein
LFLRVWRDAYLLVDEQSDEEDEDEEDNAEDDDDTNFALSPVLLALHQLVGSIVAAADDLVHVDGGHCEGGFLMEEVISWGSCKGYETRSGFNKSRDGKWSVQSFRSREVRGSSGAMIDMERLRQRAECDPIVRFNQQEAYIGGVIGSLIDCDKFAGK